MDRFKQYLQEHANELDTDLPRETVWQHIQQQTKPATPAVRRLYWPVAAAACMAALIAISTWWLWPVSRQGSTAQNLPAATTGTDSNQQAALGTAPQPGTLEAPAVLAQNQPLQRSGVKSIDHAAAADQATTNTLAEKQEGNNSEDAASIAHVETGFAHMIHLQLEKVRNTPIYAENAAYFSSFKKQFIQLDEEERTWKKRAGNGDVSEEQLEELMDIYQQKLTVLKLLQNEIRKTNKHFKQKNSQNSQHAAFMDI